MEIDNFEDIILIEFRRIKPAYSKECPGEALDSLDRIELLENLEAILKIDLLYLLTHKDTWSTFDGFIRVLRNEMVK